MLTCKSVRSAVFAAGLALAVPQLVVAQERDRYIVKFSQGRSAAGQQALRAAGAQVLVRLDPQDAVAARIPAQALTGLQRNPNIEYIEADALRYPLATDRVLSSGEILPYGIQMVQADLVTSTNESGKKLCIIDSGYSQQHVDLGDDVTGHTSGSGTWNQDSCGHGTHVAGTVLATAGNGTGVIGVVPGAGLHVVKVFGNDDLDGGSCSWTYASTLVAALNNCVDNGADVVSMSLGGTFKSRTEETAFNNANSGGVLSIAAAGNGGNRSTSYPAGYKSVVSVAAVDSNETVAAFSQQNRDVELAAPGVGVLSTVPWLPSTVTVAGGGPTFQASHIENANRSNATGTIVNGGLCDSVGSWSGQVVLCERGVISFLDKVTNVQNGGGSAAVIYNNEPGGFAGTLGAGASSAIPAVGISQEDGQAIVETHLGASVTVSDTFQTGSGYEGWNGTSMATPHVSGVAALVWSCHPSASNTDIRNALNATAKDKGSAGRDTQYGYGIVQAKAAVESLGGSAHCTTTAVSKY